MLFNRHSEVEGRHATLSASTYSWVNYDEDKMARVFTTKEAARRGTRLHNLAKDMINLGIKLEDLPLTLNRYVNDAIGYRMTPEQVLYVSDNCFGTADALGFRKNKLRIHDLKTGVGETSIKQLEIYAAMFCIEYHFNPFDIEMELRIYQNDEVRIYDADPDEIMHIIDKIKTLNKLLDTMRMEAYS